MEDTEDRHKGRERILRILEIVQTASSQGDEMTAVETFSLFINPLAPEQLHDLFTIDKTLRSDKFIRFTIPLYFHKVLLAVPGNFGAHLFAIHSFASFQSSFSIREHKYFKQAVISCCECYIQIRDRNPKRTKGGLLFMEDTPPGWLHR
jgi:hypothetical protein